MREYKTMMTLATESLKEGILDGSFEPDEMLIPQNLEKRFGYGKMAFREAIRELVGLGLVYSVANKGNFVTSPPSSGELQEIFKIRCLIEKDAAIQGTANISDEDIKKMEHLHKEMKKKSIAPRDFFFLNTDFHMLLYRASGWDYICHLINQLIEYVFMFRFRSGTQRRETQDVFTQEHALILEAVKSGNAKDVGDRIVKNIESGLKDIQKKLEGENE